MLWKNREEKARSARKKTNYMGADATVYEQLDKALTTKFVGYDKLKFRYRSNSAYNRRRSCTGI